MIAPVDVHENEVGIVWAKMALLAVTASKPHRMAARRAKNLILKIFLKIFIFNLLNNNINTRCNPLYEPDQLTALRSPAAGKPCLRQQILPA
jgi:hypothetical protein